MSLNIKQLCIISWFLDFNVWKVKGLTAGEVDMTEKNLEKVLTNGPQTTTYTM